MPTKTIQTIVFILILVHGIGHIQGIVNSLGVKFHSSSSNVSWLLKGLDDRTNRIICLVLYLTAALFGILTAFAFAGVFLSTSAWTTLALITAFASTASLILFPRALAMFFNKAGAIAVNLIIFYSILFKGNWPDVIFKD
jgi:hypothetical protein